MMANGNGNLSWRGVGVIGILVTLLTQIFLFGSWKGTMETKVDNLAEKVTENTEHHLRDYHGGSSK